MDDRSYVLQRVLDLFERENIPYSLVGDVRGYPERIVSDVDVVVARSVFPQLPGLLISLCRTYDLHLVQMIRHEQTALYFVLAWIEDGSELRALAIDACSDYLRFGRRFLTAEELLAGRDCVTDGTRAERTFYVPAPHKQFIYYLIKKIDKLELEPAHGSYLSALWREDPMRAREEIARFWRHEVDVELLSCAAQNDEWASVRVQLLRLRRVLRRGAHRTLGGLAGEIKRVVRRACAPTGAVVAFLGPDGAGKSSVIRRVLVDFAPLFRRTRYVHFRPRLRWLRARDGDKPVTDPHAHAPRGGGATLAKLVVFVLDYVAGYAVRIWPDRIASTLVVFDRYLHDMLADPQRYRCGGPTALVRWAVKCVPRPDMWVVLDAPANVLQERKAEVPIEASQHQCDEYLRLAGRLQDAFVVDAGRDLDAVTSTIENELLAWMQTRLEARYPQLREHHNPRGARVLLFFSRHRIPVLSELIRIAFNSEIYCRLRAPILMPHPYGIVIHSKTVIGRHVTVMQQVTLGGKDIGKNLAPVIEDDVYIGAGARVLGAARIGRGAIVGANAVVTRDVPPYCTVVGANRIVRGSVLGVASESAAIGASRVDGRLSA